MGANDEISDKVDDYMAGKANEGLGEATGDPDPDTENEEKLDQAKSSLKDDAGER